MNTLLKQRVFHLLSLLPILLLVTACWGDETAASVTPTLGTTPVATATEAATATTVAVASSPILVPTDTPAPTAVAQSTVTVAAASVVTANTPISPTQPVTAAVNAGESCPEEPDLDVAGYPNLKEKMGCALEAANFEPVGINEFGPGPNFDRFMLWLSTELKIYVLLPDKHWQAYDDTWREGDAPFTCNPLKETPESPPLPRRGFNKIWCTVPKLQETMGTIVREERQCQHAVMQRFAHGRLLACYEDATIRYIRLLDDGTWDTELTR